MEARGMENRPLHDDEKRDGHFCVTEGDLSEFRNEARFIGSTLLVYCSAGSATVGIDTVRYPLREGSALFILPHKMVRVEECSANFATIGFSLGRSILDEAIATLSTAVLLYIRLHPTVEIERRDRVIFPMMARQMMRLQRERGNPYREKIIANILSNFLMINYEGRIAESEQSHTLFSRSEELLKQFMTEVEIRCGELRDVASYAALLCISPKHLTCITREKTQMSPKELIDEVTLRRATGFLRNTQRSIKEIAIDCGFSNASYFTRFIKRMTGESPLHFRNKGKNEEESRQRKTN